MESSSDDSFAWTNASSDSCESDEMAADTYEKNQHDDESDSGRSYKKKLQKKLFLSSDQHNESSDGQKARKRKIKTEETENDNNDYPKKKHMKIEPESDVEIIKKKKHKHSETNGTHNSSQESLSYDESYLDLRVKEEQTFATPKKKKNRRHSNASHNSDGNELPISEHRKQKKAKKNKKDKSVELTSLDISVDDDNSITQDKEEVNGNKVKKKKKKSKESLDLSDHVDNKLTSEIILSDVDISNITLNNVSEVKKDKRLGQKDDSYSSMSEEVSNIVQDNNDSQMVIMMHHADVQHTKSPSKHRNDQDQIKPQHISKMLTNTKDMLNNSLVLPKKISPRTPKISDRIRFEDEDEESGIDTSSKKNVEKITLSFRLKQFLKEHINLKPISLHFYQNSLSQDDELWLLRCPHEVNLKSLESTNFKLDGKCKIKVNGQTYEGVAEECTSKVAILTSEHSKPVIKNLPLNGVLDLHRRIPKAHFPIDNTMVNNQTNFIPLPDTKCRHPLFGSNYKKAIKIPAVIAERLKECGNESVHEIREDRKKKKKKQKHHQPESVEMKCETETNPTPEVELVTKKKKKRKHTDNEEASKKVKRNKYNPESAEAWESEKAIEENLFNF